MTYITLPESTTAGKAANDTPMRELSFYLAMEEYVAKHVDRSDCFFMWQVEPTVIFGRNQNIESEVNIPYCREHDIRMYRRKSGGGCVYADSDNLMLSMITDDEQINTAFNRFINMLLLVLHRMGISAAGNSHNDVMIGERKVSGTACYHLAGHSIIHSTLLYDTNMEHMLQAITPPQEKLESKGIKSVRQRITLLKEHTPMQLEEIKDLIRQTVCQDTLQLTEEDVKAIEEIEKGYLDQEFIHRI